MSALIKPKKASDALAVFVDPLKAKVVISGLKAAAVQAARMKNWAASDASIEELVDWQAATVAWWRATTPDKGFGRRKSATDVAVITHAEKEAATGILRQQIDRWAERLRDRAAYVLALRRALQRVALARGSKERPTRSGLANQIRLYHCDALDFLRRTRDADLLLTDPPYMTDVDDIRGFAREWVPVAMECLKPSGRAYIFTGAYPIELAVYATLLSDFAERSGWRLDNPLVWTYRNTLGPQPSHDYKLNWQSIWHVYGPDAPPLNCPTLLEQFSVQDFNAPDARTGFRQHAWQKPEALATRLVLHGSQPGDVMIDPFCGTGTFLIAAAEAGRAASGCDNSEEMLGFCQERGIEVDAES
jgi:site-specific DNA-methyltransferase (adenine-specific)